MYKFIQFAMNEFDQKLLKSIFAIPKLAIKAPKNIPRTSPKLIMYPAVYRDF